MQLEKAPANYDAQTTIDTTLTSVKGDDKLAKKVEENELKYWPNPFKGHVIIELPENLRNSNIRLMTVEGKLIRQVPARGMKQFKLGGLETLPKGFYLIEIQNADTEPVSLKLQKL